jgi:hypothetical protein
MFGEAAVAGGFTVSDAKRQALFTERPWLPLE